MTAFEILLIVVSSYATVWALYLLIIPLVANLRAPRQRNGFRLADREWPTIAVIVPARNAARPVESCIASLRACNYPSDKFAIYVVADHCSDDTAGCAEAAGATVLNRNDGPTGKPYAIAWALQELNNRGITSDLYVIVDSTAQVEPNFLSAMGECWRHGEDIVSGHPMLSAENKSWYARCLGLMLVHRNLQCWARERLGLSALLEGRGMAYSRNYIQRFGWSLALPKLQSSHPTQDWRHAVKAVEQGCRVAFAEDARVVTPLRGSLTEATQQGARWERGRLVNAGAYGLRLLVHGVKQRDLVKVFAALDAIQPPVAILGGLSLGLAVLSMLTPRAILGGIGGLIPLIVVGLYGLGVAFKGRHEGIGLTTAMWAPFYVAWRCVTFILAWGFLDRINLCRRGKDAAGDVDQSVVHSAPGGAPSQAPDARL